MIGAKGQRLPMFAETQQVRVQADAYFSRGFQIVTGQPDALDQAWVNCVKTGFQV
jgi:hypothetical protein